MKTALVNQQPNKWVLPLVNFAVLQCQQSITRQMQYLKQILQHPLPLVQVPFGNNAAFPVQLIFPFLLVVLTLPKIIDHTTVVTLRSFKINFIWRIFFLIFILNIILPKKVKHL